MNQLNTLSTHQIQLQDTPPMAQRALVSVSNKQGLDTFVKGLVDLGFEILSTGGPAGFWRKPVFRSLT